MHVRHSLLGVGSFERADSLLYGCAAAIAVRLNWRPHPSMVWAGIAVVGCMPFVLRENYATQVVGYPALAIAAAAVVVGLDYTAPSWMRRFLSLHVIVTIGVLSYGIYLWHGPLMRIAADAGYSGEGWRAVAVLLTVLVASISHRYLETPVRLWARRRGDEEAVQHAGRYQDEGVETASAPS
jgi:peptidoglycan/LPS O-acetylase OafA/YrhL